MDVLCQPKKVTLNLVEIFSQLKRETEIQRDPPPVITLSRVTTRPLCLRDIANALQDDQTPIFLTSKSIQKGIKDRYLPPKNIERTDSTKNSFWKENTKPIRVLPGALTLKETPPPSPSPERRRKLRDLAREFSFSEWRDPYILPLRMGIFENYLPATVGSAHLVAFDAEPDDKTAAVTISHTSMIWDTAAHMTIISEDLIPPSFRDYINDADYHELYGSADGLSVQISLGIQFSNTQYYLEGIAVVRPQHTLPNNFSGIILGQHSLLDQIEYHVAPRKVLEARGIPVESDVWGDVNLVEDGQYKQLT
jgi:hypothetical protein